MINNALSRRLKEVEAALKEAEGRADWKETEVKLLKEKLGKMELHALGHVYTDV